MDPSELPMALRAAYMAMHRRTENEFAKYGITADQFVLLATLSRGEPMTQRELARQMPSDPSTVRAMLVLLEKQDLIQRETHPQDSRALVVTLTAAGKRKFRQLWKVGDKIRQRMYDAVPADELSGLIQNLKAISDALLADSSAETAAASSSTQDN